MRNLPFYQIQSLLHRKKGMQTKPSKKRAILNVNRYLFLFGKTIIAPFFAFCKCFAEFCCFDVQILIYRGCWYFILIKLTFVGTDVPGGPQRTINIFFTASRKQNQIFFIKKLLYLWNGPSRTSVPTMLHFVKIIRENSPINPNLL